MKTTNKTKRNFAVILAIALTVFTACGTKENTISIRNTETIIVETTDQILNSTTSIESDTKSTVNSSTSLISIIQSAISSANISSAKSETSRNTSSKASSNNNSSTSSKTESRNHTASSETEWYGNDDEEPVTSETTHHDDDNKRHTESSDVESRVESHAAESSETENRVESSEVESHHEHVHVWGEEYQVQVGTETIYIETDTETDTEVPNKDETHDYGWWEIVYEKCTVCNEEIIYMIFDPHGEDFFETPDGQYKVTFTDGGDAQLWCLDHNRGHGETHLYVKERHELVHIVVTYPGEGTHTETITVTITIEQEVPIYEIWHDCIDCDYKERIR